MTYYRKQSIQDIEAVIDVLLSDYLRQGNQVIEFQENPKNYCGDRYSKVVSNATSALHLAYSALGLKKDRIVWISENEFASSPSPAFHCDAKVKFIDIKQKIYNIYQLFEKKANGKRESHIEHICY